MYDCIYHSHVVVDNRTVCPVYQWMFVYEDKMNDHM